MTQEKQNRQSVAAKTRWASPEYRAKQSAAMRKRWESPTYRAKMSSTAKKFYATPEYRTKMSAAKQGQKHSPETRAKMSADRNGSKNPQWGKHPSLKTRAKISVILKARYSDPTLHPRWLGGTSREPYAWNFNAELKEEVRRRDGYKCQLCGVPQTECEKALDVHHNDYDKKNSDPVNLTTLCRACHSKTNTNREHWTKLFQAMAIARDIAALKERKSG